MVAMAQYTGLAHPYWQDVVRSGLYRVRFVR